MGKPRMIILIRHAQSEGNKNRDIHQTIPDHRVKLTPEGHRQAQEAGSHLRSLLHPDDTIHFFTSPYRRTRETTEGILQSLTSDSPAPSPFPRHTIKVYEEPRLREQDFGNFQPCSAEMERMWMERFDYGHFFYRIPNGESAADAYDRVSGFNESLWRLFGEDDFASVCVLVTHGLMTRVFLMKWYHWSVEYFEDLRNINHCEFVIMKLNSDNGKYKLQNQMRTWSELRREKEQERNNDRVAKGLAPAPPVTPSEPSVPFRRRWGGCPEGCNHGIRRKGSTRTRTNGLEPARHSHETHYKAGEAVHSYTQDGHHHHHHHHRSEASSTARLEPSARQVLTAVEPGLGDRSHETRPLERTIPSPPPQHDFGGINEGQSTDSGLPAASQHHPRPTTNLGSHKHHNHPSSASTTTPRRPNPANLHRDTEDHLLHSTRTNYALLHLAGRDGGGSLSGANSLAPSEDERDDKKPIYKRPVLPFHHHTHHHSKPSQDMGNDGDDEGTGSNSQEPRLRRSRSHRHNSNTGRKNLAKQVANMFISNNSNNQPASDVYEHDHDDEHEHNHEHEQECEYHLDPHTHTSSNQHPDKNEDEDYPEIRHEDEHNGDDDDNDNDHDHAGDYDCALEAQRREDQSLRGSVY